MGVIVLRDGDTVFERYLNGHTPDSLHDIRSATKSITALLLGIAIAEGHVESVQERWRDDIWLEHLLTMSSGLDADDSDMDSPGNENTWYGDDNWLDYLADLDAVADPGERWVYASANTFLLGAFIEDATGMLLAEFAQQSLFSPLGIEDFDWAQSPGGRTVGQGNLSLTLRDMAAIGQLTLKNGSWQGESIVPEDWIGRSVTGRFDVPWDGYDRYGYGWYLHAQTIDGNTVSYYFASGNGGNKIYVIPGENMVVAIQSAAYNTPYGQRRSLDILTEILTASRRGECCAGLALADN